MAEVQGRRENYLNWADYFMGIALVSAERSKDPERQVGACIVNDAKRIVGIGYNGFPTGCHDDEFPWTKKLDKRSKLDSKDMYVCHAELNAVLNRYSADLNNCTMYVTRFPCYHCAQIIIQSNIKKICYMSDEKANSEKVIASKRMLDAAQVEYNLYIPKARRLTIDFHDYRNQNLEL